VASTFTGIAPTDDGYFSGAGNADNLVFPPLGTGNALRLEQRLLGSLELKLENYDAHPNVSISLAACPGLYTVALTPQGRGAADARTEQVAQVTGVVTPLALAPGSWQVRITSPLAASAVYDQPVTVLPNATTAPAIRVGAINSAQTTTTGTLAIVNKSTTTDLDVYIAGNKNGTTANKNTTTNYTVSACVPIQLMVKNTSTIVDQFLMPYGVSPFARVAQSAAAAVTINNRTSGPEVRLFVNGTNANAGVQMGQVALYDTRAVTVAVGDYFVVRNNSGATISGPTQVTGAVTLNF
jgi:hypothetical protein